VQPHTTANELAPADAVLFGPWLAKWDLVADGAPIIGPNSRLLPVRRDQTPLMLKAAMQPREVRAAAYLEWLDGSGAVQVMAREGDATLMERAIGHRSLIEMELKGDGEEALRILCEVGCSLHAARPSPPAELLDLPTWFARLHDVGARRGGALKRASDRAAVLIAEQRQIRVLHGDLHHWNVLDGGKRGWLAIDPNGLMGERTLDFALMVLPATLAEASYPSVLRSRAELIAHMALDAARLLAWVSVQAALWESWSAPGRDWLAITVAAERAIAQ
jgi:streptomycin 6-kinase